MSDGYAYLGAGESGKLKFPDEHAEWTRIYAEQGYARIAADSAAKAEKKAERERSKLEAKEARAGRKSSVTKVLVHNRGLYTVSTRRTTSAVNTLDSM